MTLVESGMRFIIDLKALQRRACCIEYRRQLGWPTTWPGLGVGA